MDILVNPYESSDSYQSPVVRRFQRLLSMISPTTFSFNDRTEKADWSQGALSAETAFSAKAVEPLRVSVGTNLPRSSSLEGKNDQATKLDGLQGALSAQAAFAAKAVEPLRVSVGTNVLRSSGLEVKNDQATKLDVLQGTLSAEATLSAKAGPLGSFSGTTSPRPLDLEAKSSLEKPQSDPLTKPQQSLFTNSDVRANTSLAAGAQSIAVKPPSLLSQLSHSGGLSNEQFDGRTATKFGNSAEHPPKQYRIVRRRRKVGIRKVRRLLLLRIGSAGAKSGPQG
jgi:hypothetical protein